MYANLFGDYIKGRNYDYLPPLLQKGVHLHRTIDDFIDHHPVVVDLLHQLYADLPKIAGIAVDLYFDHLLARNWTSFHKESLRDFTNAFYNTPLEHEEHFTLEFQYMISKMKEFDWLYEYRKHEGLIKSCTGLSKRISFENVLGKAPEVFLEKESIIEEAFNNYMKDAIPFFNNYFKKD